MSSNNGYDVTSFLQLVVDQVGQNVYEKDGRRNISAYVAFFNLPLIIEYMGACYDTYDFNEERKSKYRFDFALKNLMGAFRPAYKKYGDSTSKFYLYECFRCSIVHQLKPTGGVVFTTRKEAKEENIRHLQEIEIGERECLVLILEDLYEDIQKASEKIVSEFQKGYNTKGKKHYLSVFSTED